MRAIGVGVLLLLVACGGESAPDPLRQGRSIYADTCSVCHGSRGQGGVGPALDQVTATWPDCARQVEWIALGSDGWRARHGDVYGATAKPVEGGMPAQDSLTDAEQRLVAAFERVTYGGMDREEALAACGVEGRPE